MKEQVIIVASPMEMAVFNAMPNLIFAFAVTGIVIAFLNAISRRFKFRKFFESYVVVIAIVVMLISFFGFEELLIRLF